MNDVLIRSVQQEIGNHLTDLRKKRGYNSHKKFANDFNLSRVQYHRLESGKANFTLGSLARVLAIHNISFENFFILIGEDHLCLGAKAKHLKR